MFTESFDDEEEQFDTQNQLILFNQSESTGSKQLDKSNQNNTPEITLKMSCIGTDLIELRKLFGIFTVCRAEGGFNDAEKWITVFFSYLNVKYFNPKDIFNYFHSFVDTELKKWYFKLDSGKKKDLELFKQEFIDENIKIQIKYHEYCDLKQLKFLEHLKKNTTDTQLITEINNSPIIVFFKQKFLYHSKVYQNLDKQFVTTKIIYQLDDFKDVQKYIKFRKDDVSTILLFAKLDNNI